MTTNIILTSKVFIMATFENIDHMCLFDGNL